MALEELPKDFFHDKMCVVAGGASGIGEATVHALVRRGARVLIIDVNDDDGEALVILHGPKAMYMHCEVTDEHDLEQAIQAAMTEFDLPLHAYINCDAIIGALGQIDEMQTDSFAATLDLNVKGTFLGIKNAARAMKKDAVIDGAIITLSSTAAVQTGMAPVAFTASQHAVIGVTQQAAAELAPAGIRVNCVSPTVLDTPMWRKYLKGDASISLADDLRSKQVFPHLATVEDVANAIVFLASDQASAITGSNVVVDGGSLTRGKFP